MGPEQRIAKIYNRHEWKLIEKSSKCSGSDVEKLILTFLNNFKETILRGNKVIWFTKRYLLKY